MARLGKRALGLGEARMPQTSKVVQLFSYWRKNNLIIQDWLECRQKLLVDLCALVDIGPFENRKSYFKKLNKLNQDLIDYTAFGHFKVFPTLIEEARVLSEDVHINVVSILEKVEANTDVILEFDELVSEDVDVKKLIPEISRYLSERFDLEDLMLQDLHYQRFGRVA